MKSTEHNAFLNEALETLNRIYKEKLPLLIEEMGGALVADETCMGERGAYDPPAIADQSTDGIMRALANKSTRPCTCPTFTDNKRRVYRIMQMIEDYKVQGVIYHVLRGCLVYDYLDSNYSVKNFSMNDKCAAGTGKFMEVIAQILETTIDQVGPPSLESTAPCDINSTCVVFAQSEVISLIARKYDRRDILSGMHLSMAKRIIKMMKKSEKNGDVLMTGGGALNIGLRNKSVVIHMRLLFAEDDRDISKALKTLLERSGYSVDVVFNGQDAIDYIETGEYDGVILDWMMPKLSGIEVLSQMRSKGFSTPVLILTARDSVDDRVEGLDTGADDYLPKPFAASELLARIRAMLRRKEDYKHDVIKFADIELDKSAMSITCNGKSVRLNNKAFQLMEMLVEHPGAVLSIDRIMEHIWGWDSDSEINVVWVNISFLRKKLTELGAHAKIKAIRGIGYSLEKI